MGNPLKKAAKSISKAFNKAADKLVPKELAPVLPFLPLIFGPTLGLGAPFLQQGIGRFAIPQLLTALSSAKQTGEVDPTQQLITGIMTGLQSPVEQTAAEKALLEQNPELAKQVTKANQLADATKITDPSRLKELSQAGDIEGLNVFQQDKFDLFGLDPFQPGDAFGPKEILSFTDDAGNTRFFRPDSDALTSFLNTETTTPLDLSKLTGQEFKDTIVGAGNITDVGFDKKLKALQGTEGIGSQQGLQALNKARGFFDSPIGFNKATMAKVGLGAAPYLMNQAQIMKRELEEEEAERLAQRQSYTDAMGQLGTFYSRLADPTRRFGEYEFAANGGLMGTRTAYNMGGMGSIPQTPMVPQGMQLDGRGGGFIPMGAQEKRDDVPAMLAKNEFVMTSDAVKAAGGGSIEKGAQKMYDLMNQLEAQV